MKISLKYIKFSQITGYTKKYFFIILKKVFFNLCLVSTRNSEEISFYDQKFEREKLYLQIYVLATGISFELLLVRLLTHCY